MSIRITFIEPSGAERQVEAEPGKSLMETAVANSVAGIIAECGGNCACGTCRVFVARSLWPQTGAPVEPETSMLEFLDEANPELRLSCQIEVTGACDGLVVRVSPEQR